MNKKAQLQDGKTQAFIMAVIGIGVILAIGLVVLSQLKGSVGESITATDYANATVTITNGTTTLFSDCITEEDMSVAAMYNDTTSQEGLLLSGNYSVSSNVITLDILGIIGQTESKNISYSCKEATDAYTATGTNITKLATVPTWIGILIVVVMAFLILGFFYKRK